MEGTRIAGRVWRKRSRAVLYRGLGGRSFGRGESMGGGLGGLKDSVEICSIEGIKSNTI